MAGKISAVSVAFTIYAEKLPGEVYADSSVFRVGKDTFPEMTAKIVGALGQIVNLNSTLFDKLRNEAGGNSDARRAEADPLASAASLIVRLDWRFAVAARGLSSSRIHLAV